MKKVDFGRISPALKSLGVGGTLGSSVGVMAFYALPELRAHGVTIQLAATVGAASMTALHRASLVAAPTIRYYCLMLMLVFDVHMGWMTVRAAREIRSQLQQEHYLGRSRQGDVGLAGNAPWRERAGRRPANRDRGSAPTSAAVGTSANLPSHAEGPH